MSSLPADHATSATRLSRRRVRELAAIGQFWHDGEQWWRVRDVRSRDGLVVLQRHGCDDRLATFGELAHGYAPEAGAEDRKA